MRRPKHGSDGAAKLSTINISALDLSMKRGQDIHNPGTGRKRSAENDDSIKTPHPEAKKRASRNDGDEEATTNRCQLLGCSPPRSNGVVPNWSDVEGRIRADGFDKYLLRDEDISTATSVKKNKAVILVSLYGRGYYEDNDKKRKEMVKKLLNSHDKPYERACRLFHLDGDLPKPDALLGMTPEMISFVQNYGSASGEFGFNVFQGHHIPVCRREQKAGSCFLHAAVVMAAMKEFMGLTGKGGSLRMVDMCKYVRHCFDSDELTRFLVLDLGGVSLDHMRNLTSGAEQVTRTGGDLFEPDETQQATALDSKPTCWIASQLAKNGPALVGQFVLETRMVHAKTTDREPLFLNGTNARDSKDRHAMVLVGARFVDNEWRFLLQNWWPNMPFVEVSAEYLESSKALVTFIPKEHVEIPESFERCEAAYAEANLEGSDVCASGFL